VKVGPDARAQGGTRFVPLIFTRAIARSIPGRHVRNSTSHVPVGAVSSAEPDNYRRTERAAGRDILFVLSYVVVL